MATDKNKNKIILYADYSARNIRTVQDAIAPLGFGEFIQCDDLKQTVKVIAKRKPDLVLIGLYLDGMRGIATIRAIRDSATRNDPHGSHVPVLLGAPRLDRSTMQEAVSAGIEGVFRQPIDPVRLRKIISTVMKSPRRFVLEDNYFGPARTGQPAGSDQGTTDSPKKDAPSTPTSADNATAPEPTPDTKKRRRSDIAAQSSVSSEDTVPQLPDDNSRPVSTDEETRAVPTSADRVPGTSDIKVASADTEALSDARPRTGTKPPKATVKPPAIAKIPAPTPLPAPQPEPEPEPEELIEIDLQEALVGHKLWVDTGGREGHVMFIEHADLREADLEGIDLSRCGLPHASFHKANCKNAVLRRCNLIAADFNKSNLDNAVLAASRLSGARFNDAILRNTVFLGSDLSNASFRGLQLQNCDLSGTNLNGTDFRDADLTGARGLFAEQIQRARVNANTRLPSSLKLRD